MRLAVLTTLLVLAGATPAAAATCRPTAAEEVVKRTAHAVITLNHAEDARTVTELYRGCLRSTGQRVDFVTTEQHELGHRWEVSHLRLTGRFAALLVTRIDHYGSRATTVKVVDLRRALPTTVAAYPLDGTVTELTLGSRGHVAWIVEHPANGAALQAAFGRRVLTVTQGAPPRSLAKAWMHGATLGWSEQGVWRTLPLPPLR